MVRTRPSSGARGLGRSPGRTSSRAAGRSRRRHARGRPTRGRRDAGSGRPRRTPCPRGYGTGPRRRRRAAHRARAWTGISSARQTARHWRSRFASWRRSCGQYLEIARGELAGADALLPGIGLERQGELRAGVQLGAVGRVLDHARDGVQPGRPWQGNAPCAPGRKPLPDKAAGRRPCIPARLRPSSTLAKNCATSVLMPPLPPT